MCMLKMNINLITDCHGNEYEQLSNIQQLKCKTRICVPKLKPLMCYNYVTCRYIMALESKNAGWNCSN